jgi:hypothetical protein
MSWRVGPLALAVASAAVRLTGDYGPADILAITYLAIITLHLHRAGDFRAAVRAVRS